MAKQPQNVSEKLLCPTLKPLVECCVQRAISAADVMEAVQKLFVEVSKEELLKHQTPVSESQVELMTGLSKVQVKEASKRSKTTEFSAGVIGKLLCAWEVDRKFSEQDGSPKALTFKGRKSEFSALVRSVDKKCSIAAVQRELIRRKLAEVRDEKLICLESAQSYHCMQERGMNLLYRDIRAISSAVEENVIVGPDTRNLHLRTEFDNIAPEKIPMIRKWLLREGARFHKRARAYLAKHDLDYQETANRKGGGKVVLGAFSWTE